MLRRFLPFLIAMGCAVSLDAATDPSEQFLKAYQAYQQAEKAERDGNTTEALSRYRFAESLLVGISNNDPSWQKAVVEYRLKKTRDGVSRLDGGGETTPVVPTPTLGEQSSESSRPSATASENPPGPSITIVPPSQSSPSGNIGSSAELRRLKKQIQDLRADLQEAREALTSQKNRTQDLGSVKWIEERTRLEKDLQQANNELAGLKDQLRKRDSWENDLRDLQHKLDDAVADKTATEEIYQQNERKAAENAAALTAQLQEARRKVELGTDSRRKLEELARDLEKERLNAASLQEKLGQTEQEARESSARNIELQQEIGQITAKLAEARKTAGELEPLKAKVMVLQSQVEEGRTARQSAEKKETSLRADLMALEEDRARLADQAQKLGEAAKEASKVKGLQGEADDLRKTVADLQTQLETSKRETASQRTQAETSEKAAKETAAKLAASVAAADADRTVLQEDRRRLFAKLEEAAKAGGEQGKRAEALSADANKLRASLEQNAKALEKAEANLLENEKKAGEERKQTLARAEEAENRMQEIEKQNASLQGQLKEAMSRVAAMIEKGSDSTALKEQLRYLQDQVDKGAKDYADAKSQLAEMSKTRPELEKAVQEKEKALAEAKGEATRLRAELDDSKKNVASLQQAAAANDDRLKKLQDQLARVTAAPEGKSTEENSLLRGIVLRQVKDEARKAQARRLMAEEMKRLGIQSQTISAQIDVLSSPSVALTPQERALFKEGQLEIVDTGDDKMSASVAMPISSLKPKDGQEGSGTATAGTEASQGSSPTATAKGASNFKECLAKAKEEFERQDYLKAEESFREALKYSPDDYFALSNLGVVEFQLGKLKEAESILQKAIKRSTDSSFALTTLGIVLYRQDRLEDSEKVLRKAVAANQQDFTAHNYLGIVLAASGKGKAGESEIMKAIEINPQYADAHFNLAVIYATGKPPAKMMAKKHYSKAIELGAPPDASLEALVQ